MIEQGPLYREREKNEKNHDLTPYRAQRIFENAVVNAVNETLPNKQKIHSDQAITLRWMIDKDFPEGRFGLVRSEISKRQSAPKPKATVFEVDPETGEKYAVEKMTGPVEHLEKTTTYNIDPRAIKEIFAALDPQVKETFVQGWEESLTEAIAGAGRIRAALNKELRHEEKTRLEKELADFEEGQHRIETMLKALK